MGAGFIDFCDTYYGGVWSVECAKAYSEKMGGGNTYGNPNYIDQFLRCYTFGTISGTYPGSLNARGLCAPLEPGWEQNITQRFGGMYSGSPHKGMDIGMPEGTPVYAAADGKVTVANASEFVGLLMGLLRQNQPRRGRRHAVCASIQCGGILWAVCASGRRDRLRGQHRQFIRQPLTF